jgi:hypothetical protein
MLYLHIGLLLRDRSRERVTVFLSWLCFSPRIPSYRVDLAAPPSPASPPTSSRALLSLPPPTPLTARRPPTAVVVPFPPPCLTALLPPALRPPLHHR